MIPYIDIPPLELGPLKLHPFGFLVGCAIIFGTWMADKRAEKTGLSRKIVSESAMWAVVCGFIGAHLGSVFFYTPEKLLEDPLILIKLWDGISSFGGFLGGAFGLVFYLKRKAKQPIMPYMDAILWGLCWAWIFGRLGCTVAHDHPGSPTDFFLGVDYSTDSRVLNNQLAVLIEGGKAIYRDAAIAAGHEGPFVLHDLGWYEFLFTLVLCAFLFTQRNKPLFSGWVSAVILIAYTPVRFMMDFWRVTDMELFLGLTFGQWSSIGLFMTGVWLYRHRKRYDEMLNVDGSVAVFRNGMRAYDPEEEAAASRAKGKKSSSKSKGKKKR